MYNEKQLVSARFNLLELFNIQLTGKVPTFSEQHMGWTANLYYSILTQSVPVTGNTVFEWTIMVLS